MTQFPIDKVEASRLGKVQETLLIPLYYRAVETGRSDAIIQDPIAQQIINKIDYDFAKFSPHWNIQMDVAVRTEIFDEIVRQFTSSHPNGTIINLGAGLDGRYDRLRPANVSWYDLDLPDAIELRQQFFSDGPHVKMISSSAFDWKWMDSIEGNPPVLVLAEGLFCYCKEDEIKELFERLYRRWPGTLIAFQSLCPALVGREKKVGAVNQTQARFTWGIDSGLEVSRWNPSFRLLREEFLVDRHKKRWHKLSRYFWLPWVRSWFRRVMKVSVVELGNFDSKLRLASGTPAGA